MQPTPSRPILRPVLMFCSRPGLSLLSGFPTEFRLRFSPVQCVTHAQCSSCSLIRVAFEWMFRRDVRGVICVWKCKLDPVCCPWEALRIHQRLPTASFKASELFLPNKCPGALWSLGRCLLPRADLWRATCSCFSRPTRRDAPQPRGEEMWLRIGTSGELLWAR
jgi:hypothetical protein